MHLKLNICIILSFSKFFCVNKNIQTKYIIMHLYSLGSMFDKVHTILPTNQFSLDTMWAKPHYCISNIRFSVDDEWVNEEILVVVD